MNLSRKCQYALRALFELAKTRGDRPRTSREIAEAQAIPANFLELILKELRQAGWLESSRGPNGGYTLAVSPELLSVGEVIRFIDGPFAPVKCMAGTGGRHCMEVHRCPFAKLWDRAESYLSELYDTTSLQDIVDDHAAATLPYTADYHI